MFITPPGRTLWSCESLFDIEVEVPQCPTYRPTRNIIRPRQYIEHAHKTIYG